MAGCASFAAALFMLIGGGQAILIRYVNRVALLRDKLFNDEAVAALRLLNDATERVVGILSGTIGPSTELYEFSIGLSGLFLTLVLLRFLVDFFARPYRLAPRA